MRPHEEIDNMVLIDATQGLASLSIVIDDFDSAKTCTNRKEMKMTSQDVMSPSSANNNRMLPTRSTDESLEKILKEAEHRRMEFWKLLEEYSEMVENIKRIEDNKTHHQAVIIRTLN